MLNPNSNSNFPGTHVILGKKEKFKFSQFEFEFQFCCTYVILGKKEKFKISEFEFEFCWHTCYSRKKGKVLFFSIRIRIRILLPPMLFKEKRKSLNFLNSNSNSNFAGTHVILGKKEKYKFS